MSNKILELASFRSEGKISVYRMPYGIIDLISSKEDSYQKISLDIKKAKELRDALDLLIREEENKHKR